MLSMKLAAAFAAAVLVAASCGGGAEPEAPERVEEVQAPAEPDPEPDPESEPEPVEASEPAPEPAESEPEPPCPGGEHRHDDGGACHPTDPEPEPVEVVDEPELEPVEASELAPEPAESEPEPACPGGDHRHDDGGICHPIDAEPEPVEVVDEPAPEPFDEEIEDFDPAEHVLVEPSTDPDAHPCEQVDDNADGAPGVCVVDGERFCYSEAGWGDCPGGDAVSDGSCRVVEPGDVFAFTGTTQIIGELPLVLMDEGTWRIDACLRDNDLTTGVPGRFTVSLYTPPNDEGTGKAGTLFDVESVVNGEWTTEIDLVWPDEPMPFNVAVTPVGGGTWTLHLAKIGDPQ